MNNTFCENIENFLLTDYNTNVEKCSAREMYSSIGKAFNLYCRDKYARMNDNKRACYFSAEFLVGKLTKSNLFNIGLLDYVEDFLNKKGRSLSEFENFDDLALGNGGLGRLAACFLESAASEDIPLDGFGIRYKYGYFHQKIEDNKQVEYADDWTRFNDAFGTREEKKTVLVEFGNYNIRAVPYIYYVPGYKNNRVNKLVLFESEACDGFDYESFDKGDYYGAYNDIINADKISASLYPNDNDTDGKMLRLRQQYFFTSASLKYLINEIVNKENSINNIENYISIQLNDTHPVVAIAEFIRLMIQRGLDFSTSVEKAKKIFAYTNHTVLAEALEKWEISLFKELLPDVYPIIEKLQKCLESEFKSKPEYKLRILDSKYIYMADLACYISKSINGVAKIHSEIIKKDTLSDWYKVFPEKFNNKTNGVTQRRWLFLSNPGLYMLLKELCSDEIDNNFELIKNAEKYIEDNNVLDRLFSIRRANKEKLCEYIFSKEGIKLDSDFVFDVQIKRLHEYKRQLMNILSVISIYFRLKEGKLSSFPETVFLFGAKSAPGYYMAKRIIEFINCAAEVINNDTETNKTIRVIFVSNYDVSYAEKIIPAADISEQISLAGKEASGTSNMKFMMNGAVTLGTLDGANIEIVEKAGRKNNYIFGLNEKEVYECQKDYDPLEEYESDKEIKRVVDTLIDGSFAKKNEFTDIYDSLLEDDKYLVLKDLPSYIETKIKAIKDTSDKYSFMKKCLINIANSAGFSSDRTIKEYSEEIWFREC